MSTRFTERARAAGYRPASVPRDGEWGRRFFHLVNTDGSALRFTPAIAAHMNAITIKAAPRPKLTRRWPDYLSQVDQGPERVLGREAHFVNATTVVCSQVLNTDNGGSYGHDSEKLRDHQSN